MTSSSRPKVSNSDMCNYGQNKPKYRYENLINLETRDKGQETREAMSHVTCHMSQL